MEECKPFTPAYLCGFYADTADIPGWVYKEETEKAFRPDAGNRLMKLKYLSKDYGIGKDGRANVPSSLNPTQRKVELGLFLVWFLAYRNKDRVAYAIMNGQTGEITAELPVDIKKYILFSLLIAIPLFFILNLFPTMMPAQLLILGILLVLFCGLVANVQLTRAIKHDMKESDKGKQYCSRDKAPSKDPLILSTDFTPVKVLDIPTILVGVGAALLLLFSALGPLFFTKIVLSRPVLIGAGIAAFLILITQATKIEKRKRHFYRLTKKEHGIKQELWSNMPQKLPILLKSFVALLISLVILIIYPVEDMYYYAGTILCMITTALTIIDIMKQYNRLTTRKSPQFAKRGGDENA